jgi:hypothetical protein
MALKVQSANSDPDPDYGLRSADCQLCPVRTYIVNIVKHYCTCNWWQKSGIPCRHGLAAILQYCLNPHNYVDQWFTANACWGAYYTPPLPIQDCSWWRPAMLDDEKITIHLRIIVYRQIPIVLLEDQRAKETVINQMQSRTTVANANNLSGTELRMCSDAF